MVECNTIRASDEVDSMVIVMGEAFCGKSSYIKQLLGPGVRGTPEVGQGNTYCTIQTEPYEVTINHRKVLVIDTPGLSDVLRDLKIYSDVLRFYLAQQQLGLRLKGFICLLDITHGVTTTLENHLNWLEMFCGTDAYKNITFATTKWNSAVLLMSEQQLIVREKVMLEPRFLGRFIKKGAGYYRLDGGPDLGKKILKGLVGTTNVDFQYLVPFAKLEMEGDAYPSIPGNASEILTKLGFLDQAAMVLFMIKQQDLLTQIKTEEIKRALKERKRGNDNGWTKEEIQDLLHKIVKYFIKPSAEIVQLVLSVVETAAPG